MKKITFVQKQDNSSYDPVNNFFAKKTASSISKPINIQKPVIVSRTSTNMSVNTNKKIPQKESLKPKIVKTQVKNRIKDKSQPILTKQQINANTFGQQSIYLIKQDSNNNKFQEQQRKVEVEAKRNLEKRCTNFISNKVQKVQRNQKNYVSKKHQQKIEPPIDYHQQMQPKQIIQKQKDRNTKANNNNGVITTQKQTQPLKTKIKDLQKSIQQYERKLSEFQQKQEEFIKTQEKYKKLQKQHKLCAQKNKNIQLIKSELEQKQNLIKNLTAPQSNISFFKKRNALLLNKIQQLKRTNRDLVLRIKSYKGTDLVEMALHANQNQICRQYEIEYNQNLEQYHAEVQSMLSEFIILIHQFLQNKTKKNKQTKQTDQNQFLLKISSLAQKISLTYIDKFKLCPLPKCNQDAINVYAQIQKTRNRQQMKSIIQKQDLNFSITQQNIQILNNIQSNIAEMADMRMSIPNSQKNIRKEKNSQKNKINQYLEIYQKRCNFHTLFFIQALCQLTFLKDWLNKKLKQLQKELTNFYGRVKQIKNIVDLGGNTAKQSLWIYIETNIQEFMLIVPNLNIKIKGIQVDYQQLQNIK